MSQKLSDYLSLTKPRISGLVLFTVAVGYYVASRGEIVWPILLQALWGTFLVAAGANTLNQLFERESDSKMLRTSERPLPAGRLGFGEALLFGILCGLFGVLWLGIAVNWLSGILASVTFASYVFLYTPLKRRSTLNTIVGAVPGALPPVIGWAATGADLQSGAWVLFGIVFLWQFPHVLAIAWLYREDYEKAELKMLPSLPGGAKLAGLFMVGYCLALLPVSLMPAMLKLADSFYFFGALALGLVYLAYAVSFCVVASPARAKGLLRASLVYLPSVLGLMVLDVRWI